MYDVQCTLVYERGTEKERDREGERERERERERIEVGSINNVILVFILCLYVP